MRKAIGAAVGGLALLAMTAGAPGCVMTPRTASNLATAAIWAAAIAGTVVVLEAHDAHYHYESCGHYRRWYDDRWVYYYHDHWEYYDEASGEWYVYAD